MKIVIFYGKRFCQYQYGNRPIPRLMMMTFKLNDNFVCVLSPTEMVSSNLPLRLYWNPLYHDLLYSVYSSSKSLPEWEKLPHRLPVYTHPFSWHLALHWMRGIEGLLENHDNSANLKILNILHECQFIHIWKWIIRTQNLYSIILKKSIIDISLSSQQYLLINRLTWCNVRSIHCDLISSTLHSNADRI